MSVHIFQEDTDSSYEGKDNSSSVIILSAKILNVILSSSHMVQIPIRLVIAECNSLSSKEPVGYATVEVIEGAIVQGSFLTGRRLIFANHLFIYYIYLFYFSLTRGISLFSAEECVCERPHGGVQIQDQDLSQNAGSKVAWGIQTPNSFLGSTKQASTGSCGRWSSNQGDPRVRSWFFKCFSPSTKSAYQIKTWHARCYPLDLSSHHLQANRLSLQLLLCRNQRTQRWIEAWPVAIPPKCRWREVAYCSNSFRILQTWSCLQTGIQWFNRRAKGGTGTLLDPES